MIQVFELESIYSVSLLIQNFELELCFCFLEIILEKAGNKVKTNDGARLNIRRKNIRLDIYFFVIFLVEQVNKVKKGDDKIQFR